MSFHEESGSMAINPSASDRQRRRATRRSCTASASKPAAARSHSTSTRSIQARRPSFGLVVARWGLTSFGLGFGLGFGPGRGTGFDTTVAPFVVYRREPL